MKPSLRVLIPSPVISLLLLTLCLASPQAYAATADVPELRERLKDEHALGANHWIYNDFEKARAEARRTNKPLFVTFRCVPCAACNAFDAEVAKGSQVIRFLASTEFIPLRLVEMKGVDLTQFQFDYDLNWAAMFLNADGTVYGRYGTQSADGPDAYNSIESLQKAMFRVVELHKNYSKIAPKLATKRGPVKPYKTALEMPGLDRKEKLRGRTERNNCVHCHNIHDAENRHAQDSGTFTQDLLWRFPLPDTLGVHIDPKDGQRVQNVIENSAAARSGLKPGDVIKEVAGQPIISIADIQWVLDQLPNKEAALTVLVDRGGKALEKTMTLKAGWKKSDISWRGSLWSVSPRMRMWAPDIKAEERKKHDLAENQNAMLVKWINQGKPGGRAVKKAGIREGDIIVGMEGKPLSLTGSQFHQHVKLNYKVGDNLPLTVFRNGKEMKIDVPLVE